MNPPWLFLIKVLVLKRNSNSWWKGVLKAGTKGPKLCEFYFHTCGGFAHICLVLKLKTAVDHVKIRSRRDRVWESSKTDILKQIYYQQMWLLLTASRQTGQTCSLDYSTVFFVVVIVDIQNIMWVELTLSLALCVTQWCVSKYEMVFIIVKNNMFFNDLCFFTVINLPRCDSWSFTSS